LPAIATALQLSFTPDVVHEVPPSYDRRIAPGYVTPTPTYVGATTAMRAPSEETETALQCVFVPEGPSVLLVHVTPESDDIQTEPNPATATILEPSALDATDCQMLVPPASLLVHVTPESVDVKIAPFLMAATTLVPSADTASLDPGDANLAVQVTPESDDV
jgi:hypothetical protein